MRRRALRAGTKPRSHEEHETILFVFKPNMLRGLRGFVVFVLARSAHVGAATKQ
jgi:hypothetical protein